MAEEERNLSSRENQEPYHALVLVRSDPGIEEPKCDPGAEQEVHEAPKKRSVE